MLQTLKKFFDFCGEDNRRMFIASIWLGVVSAICSAMRIPAAAIVIQALLERNVTMATLWTSLGIIVISLIITIAINMKAIEMNLVVHILADQIHGLRFRVPLKQERTLATFCANFHTIRSSFLPFS